MPPAAAIPKNEIKRLKVLWQYDVLDTVPEEVFDDLTDLAAHICEAPVALISLVDENRQWFKAKVGMSMKETSRDISFCAHAILNDDLLLISDATKDPRFHDNPLVTGPQKIRFYAGAPLVTPDGHALVEAGYCPASGRLKEPGHQSMYEAGGSRLEERS